MSDLSRSFSHNQDGQPVMLIYKKLKPTDSIKIAGQRKEISAYVIELADAFIFSRDHFPMLVPVPGGFDELGNAMAPGYVMMSYDRAMFAKCEELCNLFNLGVITSRKMADIASMIEDGLGDLLSMKPQVETERTAIGEAVVEAKDSEGGGFKKTLDI